MFPATAYYAPSWVGRLQGIVNGTDTNTFEPDRPVTREENGGRHAAVRRKLGRPAKERGSGDIHG